MSTLRRLLGFASLLLLCTMSAVIAGSLAPVDVTVANSSGKVVYKGKIIAGGTFATPQLAPGDYVVQFNAKHSLEGGPFALVVSAGKKKVVADSLAGEKFTKGGVAMRVAVAKAQSVTGQLAAVGAGAKDGETVENGVRVKYLKGKKYVWVTGGLGSNLGGRWEEAGSPAARNVQNLSSQSLQDLQSRSQSLGGSSGN